MANVRKSVAPAFRSASEQDPSELPKCLERLQEYLLDQVEYDCRNFVRGISEWKDNQLWRHFNTSWEEFVSEHIKQPIEWIDHVIQGVGILDSSNPVKAQDAVAASKQRAIALAKDPKPLNNNGGDRTVAIEQSDYNQTARGKTAGTSPDYIAARLARDDPEGLEKVKAGDYPSMRAAAIDRGILKPRQQFTVGHSTSPESFAKTLLKKLDPDFLSAAIELIAQHLSED